MVWEKTVLLLNRNNIPWIYENIITFICFVLFCFHIYLYVLFRVDSQNSDKKEYRKIDISYIKKRIKRLLPLTSFTIEIYPGTHIFLNVMILCFSRVGVKRLHWTKKAMVYRGNETIIQTFLLLYINTQITQVFHHY